MSKRLTLHADNQQDLCLFGKAISVPTRIEILKLLYFESLNVAEIAEKLRIPASSAGLHIKVLEAAGLIHTEVQPGSHGSMKLCSRKSDFVTINLTGDPQQVHETSVQHMPIGAYTDCDVHPTCGMCGEDGYIGDEDQISSFYLAERIKAQIIWTSSGYLEYRFANPVPAGQKIKCLALSFECCSEAPNYREDWKSDISVSINNAVCGVWTSPGDFGARRGTMNPQWWADGNTQYGILTNWAVRAGGTWVNGHKVSEYSAESIDVGGKPFIAVRIGNDPAAEYVGGFNIFGARFGDYPQDIILTIEY